MKALADDKEVEDRIYYYLLDWNEKDDWQYIYDNFRKRRLCDLNIKEFYFLFGYAAQSDLQQLIKSF